MTDELAQLEELRKVIDPIFAYKYPELFSDSEDDEHEKKRKLAA